MGIFSRPGTLRVERDVALSCSLPRSAATSGRDASSAASPPPCPAFRHPNIVSAFDAGETHGLLFLVMELVDGMDLSTREGEGPAVPGAIDCLLQAALRPEGS